MRKRISEEVRRPWLACQPFSFPECHNVRKPGKCDTESPRKKVEAEAIFSDDPRIIRKVRQKRYRSLAIREMRVKGTLFARYIVGAVDDHNLSLEYATIVPQSK